MATNRQFTYFYFFPPVSPSANHLSLCVTPFFLFASVFNYLSLAWLFPLKWCSYWNSTPSHLNYLHYLDNVDILGECDNDGEVDEVWWNSWSSWFLLVSKTRYNGPGGFNIVPNRTAYPLLWYFLDGWCYLISPLRLSYLSAWVLPVVGGQFPQGLLWLVPMLWCCKTMPLLLPPLPLKLHDS